jgi:hypothetical protein
MARDCGRAWLPRNHDASERQAAHIQYISPTPDEQKVMHMNMSSKLAIATLATSLCAFAYAQAPAAAPAPAAKPAPAAAPVDPVVAARGEASDARKVYKEKVAAADKVRDAKVKVAVDEAVKEAKAKGADEAVAKRDATKKAKAAAKPEHDAAVKAAAKERDAALAVARKDAGKAAATVTPPVKQ